MFAARVVVLRQAWICLPRTGKTARILDLLESSGLVSVVQVRRVGLLDKVGSRRQQNTVADGVEEGQLLPCLVTCLAR